MNSGTDLANVGFWAQRRCDLCMVARLKSRKDPHLCLMPLQKYIFCSADFDSTMALDQLCPICGPRAACRLVECFA